MITEAKMNKKFYDILSGSFYKPSIGLLSNVYVAGGAVTSLMSRGKASDFDLFIEDPAYLCGMVNLVLKKIMSRIGHRGRLYLHTEKVEEGLYKGELRASATVDIDDVISQINNFYRLNKGKNFDESFRGVKFLSRNSISFGNKCQLILRFSGAPEKVVKTFDFEHCKCYWRPHPLDLKGGVLSFPEASMKSYLSKELKYTGGSYAILSALARIQKFSSRGWTIGPASCLRLATDFERFDFRDPVTLKEQLAGFYGLEDGTINQIITENLKEGEVDLEGFITQLSTVA